MPTPDNARIEQARIDGIIWALEVARTNPGNIDMMLVKYRAEREQLRVAEVQRRERLGIVEKIPPTMANIMISED